MSPESDGVASPDRRRLLASVFWAVSAAIGALLSVPIVGFLTGPLFRRQARVGANLGAVESFPLNLPRRVDFAVRQRDGWAITAGLKSAWVVRSEQGVRVFDPRCTHLGCAYHWHATTSRFLCPCHNGVYDVEGRVVSGPPPRPLDTFEAWIDGGSLYVSPTPVRSA